MGFFRKLNSFTAEIDRQLDETKTHSVRQDFYWHFAYQKNSQLAKLNWL
jgi:hypothetical protein